MNAVIIEDHEAIREELHQLVAQYCPDIVLAGAVATVVGAWPLARETDPGLIFFRERDLLTGHQPPGTDVIATVEVGYFQFNVAGTALLVEHLIHGWYADKESLDISQEVPESLPEPEN